MNYCMKCEHVFETEGECPFCGSKKVREPQNEDLCFLTEKGSMWSEMLSDVLAQNGVRFLKRGNLGAGLATMVGRVLESDRFYVTYEDYAAARDIVNELFSGEGGEKVEEAEDEPEE